MGSHRGRYLPSCPCARGADQGAQKLRRRGILQGHPCVRDADPMPSSPPRSHCVASAPIWKQLRKLRSQIFGLAGMARPIGRAPEWGQGFRLTRNLPPSALRHAAQMTEIPMTTIICARCGATATVRRTAPNKLQVSYDGKALSWQCHEVRKLLAAGGTWDAGTMECSNMNEAARTQA
jgi:hypothetical protein